MESQPIIYILIYGFVHSTDLKYFIRVQIYGHYCERQVYTCMHFARQPSWIWGLKKRNLLPLILTIKEVENNKLKDRYLATSSRESATKPEFDWFEAIVIKPIIRVPFSVAGPDSDCGCGLWFFGHLDPDQDCKDWMNKYDTYFFILLSGLRIRIVIIIISICNTAHNQLWCSIDMVICLSRSFPKSNFDEESWLPLLQKEFQTYHYEWRIQYDSLWTR